MNHRNTAYSIFFISNFYKLILFENQIQTTSASPCRISATSKQCFEHHAASFLVCSLSASSFLVCSFIASFLVCSLILFIIKTLKSSKSGFSTVSTRRRFTTSKTSIILFFIFFQPIIRMNFLVSKIKFRFNVFVQI
ncbi:extracellular solute-binding protein [Streptococcus pneumoniae]|nr:extracellular solute-binding protein [Streptococcus pneumoniae]